MAKRGRDHTQGSQGRRLSAKNARPIVTTCQPALIAALGFPRLQATSWPNQDADRFHRLRILSQGSH